MNSNNFHEPCEKKQTANKTENTPYLKLFLSKLNADEANILKLAIEFLLIKNLMEDKLAVLVEKCSDNGSTNPKVVDLQNRIQNVEHRAKNVLDYVFIGPSKIYKFDLRELSKINSHLKDLIGKKNSDLEQIKTAVRLDLQRVGQFIKNSYCSQFFSVQIPENEQTSVIKTLSQINGEMADILFSPNWNSIKYSIYKSVQNNPERQKAKADYKERRKKAKEESAKSKMRKKVYDIHSSMKKDYQSGKELLSSSVELLNKINQDERFKEIIDLSKYDTLISDINGKLREYLDLYKELKLKTDNFENTIPEEVECLNGLKQDHLSLLNNLRHETKRLRQIYVDYLDILNNFPQKLEKYKGKYGLYVGKILLRPLMMLSGDTLQFISGKNAHEPLKIETIPLPAGFDKKLFKLKDGDFCDAKGYKLPTEATSFAARCFQQILTGISILPSPTEPTGYKIKNNSKESHFDANEIQFRHWGQLYLAHPDNRLFPDKIENGELLGSGGSYKAFVFGDKTIVEFDMEEHGTYFFKTEYFQQLRKWSRTKILKEKPEGFIGRIVHDNSRECWFNKIRDFLGISNK